MGKRKRTYNARSYSAIRWKDIDNRGPRRARAMELLSVLASERARARGSDRQTFPFFHSSSGSKYYYLSRATRARGEISLKCHIPHTMEYREYESRYSNKETRLFG